MQVVKAFRLGQKAESRENDGSEDASPQRKGRLMLVKFASKEDAAALFEKRFTLKDVGFPNVYLNKDMSKEEREIQFKLRQELRAKGKSTHKIFQGSVIPRTRPKANQE